MSQVVDHLAELTAFRDRDVLDVTLVMAFNDLLQPLRVAIYRPAGDSSDRHWLTRARLERGQSTPTADSAWVELESLPALLDHPERLRCLEDDTVVVHADAEGHTTLFPLDTEREVIGVLEVHSEQPLGDEQRRLVGSVLRVFRNFQGLLDYSERDTLTGLLNRKTFDDSVLRMSAQPPAAPAPQADDRRAAHPGKVWLGVIDIDHFKRINDQHGHLIGDEVLLLMARLMRGCFRHHDLLYRFGGEEFVALVGAGTAERAAVAFERMRAAVQAYQFPRVGQVTVSVGYTDLRPGDTPAGAFDRADKAIYYAKQNGRNRVVYHGELVQRGLMEDESRGSDVELF